MLKLTSLDHKKMPFLSHTLSLSTRKMAVFRPAKYLRWTHKMTFLDLQNKVFKTANADTQYMVLDQQNDIAKRC